MSTSPTPFPGGETWHVETGALYPAVMDKLAQLSDQVRALSAEVTSLRLELRGLRSAVLGFVVVVALGLGAVVLIDHLR
jgi:hypothetical protein